MSILDPMICAVWSSQLKAESTSRHGARMMMNKIICILDQINCTSCTCDQWSHFLLDHYFWVILIKKKKMSQWLSHPKANMATIRKTSTTHTIFFLSCYQSLLLLAHLIRNGSERVVTSAREHLYDLRSLESYHFVGKTPFWSSSGLFTCVSIRQWTCSCLKDFPFLNTALIDETNCHVRVWWWLSVVVS